MITKAVLIFVLTVVGFLVIAYFLRSSVYADLEASCTAQGGQFLYNKNTVLCRVSP